MDNEKKTNSIGTKMSKNTLIMLIAVVVLSVALVVSLVLLATTSGNNNGNVVSSDTGSGSQTEIVEGEETGVYYYANGTEEFLITLNSGSKFTYLVDGTNKSGTYAYENGTLTLTFNKAEDGVMTATVVDGTLVLTQNNTEMRFLKKVNYTVTFDSKGGSAVSPVTVVNGKGVTLPEAPVYAGYIFAGWCTDAECTNFVKTTDVITSDTTLYAKWVAVTPGKTEYVVTFNYNDDVTEDAKVNTVGGQLLYVDTPTKDGYTFNGWWISDYESEDKLTCKYEAGMVFDENTTLFADWTDAKAGTELTSVDVTANGISWNAVTDVINYEVVVEGPAGFVNIDTTQGATTKAIDFANAPAGDYYICITAKMSSESNNSSVVRYYKNKALSRVSNFSVIDPSTLVFAPVDNATAYYITVDCGTEGHNHNAFYLGKSTFFNFANCGMQPEGISFYVVATADGYANSVSNDFVYVRNLDKAEVTYNEKTQSVVWANVANATGYVVSLTCGETVVLDNEYIGNVNSYSLKEYAPGEITFSITPVTQGYNSPEATSYTFTKENLATPSGLKIVDTVLSWNAVEGATGYSVKVGETVIATNITATEYDLVTALEWVAGVDYAVSVIAHGVADSAWSDAVDMRYYAISSSLSYSNNVVTWSPVIGAVRYEVSINGGANKSVSGGETSYPVKFERAGLYTVAVRYYDNTNLSSDWATIEIEVYAIDFDTRGGSGVASIYRAVGDTYGEFPVSTKAGYTLEGWYNVAGGLEMNGAAYDVDDVFTAGYDIIIYAYWEAEFVNVSFDLGSIGTWGEDEAPADSVEFMSNDYYLSVPQVNDTSYVFAGWYTGTNGSGVRLTDDMGASLSTWTFTSDDEAVVYAYFVKAFKFTLLSDQTYSVSREYSAIKLLTSVTVPYEYSGSPVSFIDAYAFYQCYYLRSINIPDTIQGVDTSTAFIQCNRLEEINVYEVTDERYKTVIRYYHSYDGALLWDNDKTGSTEIAYFPQAKTGEYYIPEGVDQITYKVFAGAKITKVSIPSSVTMIYEGAFYECASLKEVVFEEGENQAPLQIDSGAFSYCTALVTISFPKRTAALAIDEDTNEMTIFKGCTSLSAVHMAAGNARYASNDGVLTNAAGDTIIHCPAGRRGVYKVPAKVTTIGSRAFANCLNLTGIELHSNVLEVGDYAFYGCSNVTYVTFKGKAMTPTVVGDYAFAMNVDLVTLTFEDGSNVTEIGNYAFFGCDSLKLLTIPSSLEKTGEYAFADCISIIEIEFAENGKSVEFGAGTFSNCKSLTSVNLPATIDTLPLSAFEGCDNIKGIYVDDANPYFCDEDGVVYDKNKTIIYFYSLRNGNITLPDTVTEIKGGVFKNNAYITEFTFGENITVIGASAFEGCNRLATVTFEDSDAETLTIGERAFYNCYLIESFTIPARMTVVSDYLLGNAIALNEVVWHDNITYIGDYAFAYTGIAPTALPTAVTEIGDYAFARTKISSVKIPSTLVNLGEYVFEGCGSLTEADLTEASVLTAIPDGVFKGTAIKEVFIPNTVTQIGAYAFDSIGSLESVVFEEGNDDVDLIIGKYREYSEDVWFIGSYTSFTFSNCQKLTEIVFPKRLTIIGECAFYYNKNLAVATVPVGSRLRHVGGWAFAETAISEFYFPNTMADIDEYTPAIANGAFASCYSLENLVFENGGTNPMSITHYTFDSNSVKDYVFPSNISFIGLSNGGGDNLAYLTSALGSSFGSITIMDGGEGKYATDENGWLYSSDYSTLYFVPSQYKGDLVIKSTVNRIAMSAIKCNPKKVVFEEGETELQLDTSAFSGKSNITELVLSNRIKTIPSRAFYGLSKLKSLTIPASVEIIEDYGFANMTQLLEINFEEGSNLKAIGDYAFQSAGNANAGKETRLKEITIPKSVLAIGDYAFTGSYKTAGSSSKGMTSNLPVITNVIFEEGSELTGIGNYAFNNMHVEEIVLPSKVKELGLGLFGPELKKVTLSNEIQNFSDSIFYYLGYGNWRYPTDKLAEIVVPEANPYYKNGTLENGDPDTRVVLSKDGTKVVYFAQGADASEYVIPDEVTTIGKNAFRKQNLGSVTISENVISVEEYAFFDANITSLTIEGGTKPLVLGKASFAFNNITGELFIPSRVVEIGAKAFTGDNKSGTAAKPQSGTSDYYEYNLINEVDTDGYQKQSLTKVTFEEENSLLEKIGSYAFYYTTVSSINIPKGVHTIGDGAFYGALNLTEVIFQEGNNALSRIAVDVFYQCTALTSIDLPSSISEIGESAFENCYELTSVNISENVSEIGKRAFMSCTSLESINIPGTVSTIADYAFYGCSNVTELVINPGVETIGSYAFYGLDNITSVEIPASVNSVGAYAFDSCDKLAEVTLSSTMTSIGNYTFRGAKGLTSVTIPSNIETIGNNAFENCTNLAEVLIANGVESIGNYAFKNTAITTLYIPASVSSLGLNPVMNCKNFEGYEIDSGNMDFLMEDGILYNYGKTEIVIFPSNFEGVYVMPETLTSITAGAFQGSGITEVVLSKALTELPSNAFSGSSELTKVTFHEGLTFIGDYAFESCESLVELYTIVDGVEEVGVPSTVRRIGEYAFSYTGITEFEVGKLVADYRVEYDEYNYDFIPGIGYGAFAFCYDLATVTFEEGGREQLAIGDYAFQETAIETITLPFRVRTPNLYYTEWCGIGQYAFGGCANLTEVKFEQFGDASLLDMYISVDSYAFSGCVNLVSIDFPAYLGDVIFRYNDWDCYYMESQKYSFGRYAFSSDEKGDDYGYEACTSLVRVGIIDNPSNTYTFSQDAFSGCSSLAEFDMPTNVGGYASRLFKGTALTEISLPMQIFWGETYEMFMDCKSLTKVTLARDTSYWGGQMNVGTRMFKNCDNLKEVVFEGNMDEWIGWYNSDTDVETPTYCSGSDWCTARTVRVTCADATLFYEEGVLYKITTSKTIEEIEPFAYEAYWDNVYEVEFVCSDGTVTFNTDDWDFV